MGDVNDDDDDFVNNDDDDDDENNDDDDKNWQWLGVNDRVGINNNCIITRVILLIMTL